jgi:hypothetical protein
MIPYWAGFANAGLYWRFTGFVFGVEDGNSYIAKMLSGAAGAWLFRTPYSAMDQNGFLAFFPYILLGKLTSGPGQHEQLVILFQLFRVAAGFCMIFATYDFISLFLTDPIWRKLTLVLISVGGGIGWLFLLIGGEQGANRFPLEFYSPETFGFLSFFGMPHLAAARALLLWGLMLYLDPQKKLGRINRGVAGGIAWLALGFFQPLTVAIGWVVLVVHLAFLGALRWLRNRQTNLAEWDDWVRYCHKAIIVGAISAPIVLYTLISFWLDPFLSGWSAQNLIQSPPPIDYLLAYGLVLPFALLSIKRVLINFPLKGPLLVGWLFVLPFLAYAPFNLQRRLLEGGWITICVLAFVFLHRWQVLGRILAVIILVVAIFPAMIMVIGRTVDIERISEPVYQPAERISAFQYFNEHAEVGDVVLAAYTTSNALPAWAPMRVIIGLGPESVGLAELRPRVERFYLFDTTDRERVELLYEMKVRYVFWGPEEANLGDAPEKSWQPLTAGYLQKVYSQDDYHIFEVQGCDDASK